MSFTKQVWFETSEKVAYGKDRKTCCTNYCQSKRSSKRSKRKVMALKIEKNKR
jgi:hypothetical protein